MHVIVIGAGEVGRYLAQILVEEKHDVCVIEQDEQLALDLDQRIDASVIHGTGVSREVLFRAGISKADLLLAVTRVDEVNLIAAMTAERLRPECRTVARVRDPRYRGGTDAISAQEFGVDYLVGPEQTVADQVVSLLRYIGPGQISTIGKGQVSLLEVPVTAHSPLAYATSEEVRGAAPEGTSLIACSGDNGLRFCAGTDRFEIGERVFVLIPQRNVGDFLALASEDSHAVKRVLIVGGRGVGEVVARCLCSLRIEVTLIERDRARAEALAVKLPRATVIAGDATDAVVFERQMSDGQDAVVVLLSDNETSLWIGLVAKHLGATKVIARAGKRAYAPIAYKHGIDAVISPRRAMADAILRYARRGRVSATVMLGDHEGELVEFTIGKHPGHGITETPVAGLKLPDDSMVVLIVRGSEIVSIADDTVIEPGDHVIAIALRSAVSRLDAFFA